MAKRKRAKETQPELIKAIYRANAKIDAAAEGWAELDRMDERIRKAGLDVTEVLIAAGMIG